jgi:hypothetical protein
MSWLVNRYFLTIQSLNSSSINPYLLQTIAHLPIATVTRHGGIRAVMADRSARLHQRMRSSLLDFSAIRDSPARLGVSCPN